MTIGNWVSKIGATLDKVWDIACKFLVFFGVVLLFLWVIVFTAFVTSRILLSQQWLFVEVFTRQWLVLITAFSLAYTLRHGGHIKVDFVTRLLRPRVEKIVAVVTEFLALVFCAYLIQKGMDWFWYGFEKGVRSAGATEVLVWPFYLAIPIGFGVFAVGLLRNIYFGMMRLIWGEDASLHRKIE